MMTSLQRIALNLGPQHRFDGLLFFLREFAVSGAALSAAVERWISCLLRPVTAISATSEHAIKAKNTEQTCESRQTLP
jgi:hypothetical protein